MTPLIPVLEIKRTLAGVEKHFQCHLLAADGAEHAVVLWVAREPMHVHGVDLPAGTVSLGHFWTDRHYNVYHWVDGNRRTMGFYFNVADQTEIRADPACIRWRDLVIDVLATPDGRLDVLDEDELPAALDPETAAHIEEGRREILTSPAALLAEIEAASRPLLPLIPL
jgi:predicted RNA-binding protein associated with RNAse of E/G family